MLAGTCLAFERSCPFIFREKSDKATTCIDEQVKRRPEIVEPGHPSVE